MTINRNADHMVINAGSGDSIVEQHMEPRDELPESHIRVPGQLPTALCLIQNSTTMPGKAAVDCTLRPLLPM